jgi:phospholipase/lecithinase/hemolysin
VKNYAYGGATIDDDNLVAGFSSPNRTAVPDVRQQIVNYLATNDVSTSDLSRTVFIIWAGVNDYLNNSSLTADIIVASLINAAYDLLVAGISNLIVINQPPIDVYPFLAHSPFKATLHNRILDHNRFLLLNLTKLEVDYEQTSIRLFDIYSLLTGLLENASDEHWIVNASCWTLNDAILVSNCSNPEQYIFIDDYHFTSTIHRIIGSDFRRFLCSSATTRVAMLNMFVFVYAYLLVISSTREMLIY